MNSLRELELVLDKLANLSATFSALDIANQCENFNLHKQALTAPSQDLTETIKEAQLLWRSAWNELKVMQFQRKQNSEVA